MIGTLLAWGGAVWWGIHDPKVEPFILYSALGAAVFLSWALGALIAQSTHNRLRRRYVDTYGHQPEDLANHVSVASKLGKMAAGKEGKVAGAFLGMIASELGIQSQTSQMSPEQADLFRRVGYAKNGQLGCGSAVLAIVISSAMLLTFRFLYESWMQVNGNA